MNIADSTRKFESIFHLYKDRVYSFVLAIVKSDESAEEVTQEIMIKLWLCREMLDQVENLEAYIFVIVRNKAIDHLRKAAYDVRLLNNLKAYVPDEVNNIDDRIAAKDYEIVVQQAIDRLSPQRRRVFELSRQDGLNHDEIAEKLNLSKNTVKNHLVDALRIIRNHLYRTGAISAALLILAFKVLLPGFCD